MLKTLYKLDIIRIKRNPMKVDLGYLMFDGIPFHWDLVESANFHATITGYSGSGKTYTINKLIQQIAYSPDIERVYIFDVHGDIGDDLGSACSTVDFSEVSGNGINIMEISASRKYGGPRKRINEIIKTMGKAGSPLGSRQIPALSRYMQAVYALKGIKMKDPSTWGKKSPTLVDLKYFLKTTSESLEIGTTFKVAQALDNLNLEVKSMANNAEDIEEGIEGAEEKLEEYKVAAKDAYNMFIDGITTGDEFVTILEQKKNAAKMIESLVDRIQILEDSGIFNGGGIAFNPTKKIFRFDLRTLSLDEKIMFIDTMSKRIYDHAISKGITDRAREIMVIDEASDFLSNDKDSIYNKIAIGSRKYGLGVIFASQSLHHFPDDILMNTAMKIILGVDNLYTKQVSDKIRVKENQLKYLKPKVSALSMVRSKDPEAPEGWQQIALYQKHCKSNG